MSTCFVIHEHDLSMLTCRHDESPDPPKTRVCKTDQLLCNKSSVCSLDPSCAVTMIIEFARF